MLQRVEGKILTCFGDFFSLSAVVGGKKEGMALVTVPARSYLYLSILA